MATLESEEALQLLPPLVARVAGDLGVRILLIKGPVTQMHGLRPPRRYVDVDVLVDPAAAVRLRERLAELGWTYRGGRMPSVLGPQMALPLRHDLWPIELDLHHQFPGFLAPPEHVFDVLWDDRTSVRRGGVDVPAAGHASSVVIAGLHALRTPDLPLSREELAHLEHHLRRASPDRRAAVVRLATATGAAETVAPLLRAAGLATPSSSVSDARALADWRLHTAHGAEPSLAWLHALRAARGRERVDLLVRGLLGASEYDVRTAYPTAPPGRRGLWRARWWRLRRAAQGLPAAMRVLRSDRRLRRRTEADKDAP